eukprot:1443118-Prymnesium_polylepis.1
MPFAIPVRRGVLQNAHASSGIEPARAHCPVICIATQRAAVPSVVAGPNLAARQPARGRKFRAACTAMCAARRAAAEKRSSCLRRPGHMGGSSELACAEDRSECAGTLSSSEGRTLPGSSDITRVSFDRSRAHAISKVHLTCYPGVKPGSE